MTDYLDQRKQRVVINGQESDWISIKSGVPQGSVLGPLLFVISINDLEKNLKCNVKFFADDTSLFSVVNDPLITASDLNKDLKSIADWALQWKMSFNPDPLKPAEEIIFSCKKVSVKHPPLLFNDSPVKRVESHKHLGLILDSKLTFTKHINEKVKIARKWIGIIKLFRPYLPLKSLEQIYKMQIRPHFDYCDIIYHKPIITHDFNSTLTLNYNMDLLEKTQYQSALAITGAWQGTNTDKIYEELGWESFHNRRFCRRLIMIYKILNNLSPNYLRLPLPVTQNIYALRRNLVLNPIYCRKLKFKHSFYPDAIDSWNRIDNDLKNSTSLQIFKSSLLKIIRPNKKAIFDLVDPVGTK